MFRDYMGEKDKDLDPILTLLHKLKKLRNKIEKALHISDDSVSAPLISIMISFNKYVDEFSNYYHLPANNPTFVKFDASEAISFSKAKCHLHLRLIDEALEAMIENLQPVEASYNNTVDELRNRNKDLHKEIGKLEMEKDGLKASMSLLEAQNYQLRRKIDDMSSPKTKAIEILEEKLPLKCDPQRRSSCLKILTYLIKHSGTYYSLLKLEEKVGIVYNTVKDNCKYMKDNGVPLGTKNSPKKYAYIETTLKNDNGL